MTILTFGTSVILGGTSGLYLGICWDLHAEFGVYLAPPFFLKDFSIQKALILFSLFGLAQYYLFTVYGVHGKIVRDVRNKWNKMHARRLVFNLRKIL